MTQHPRLRSLRRTASLAALFGGAGALGLLSSCAPDSFKLAVTPGRVAAAVSFHARPGEFDGADRGSRGRVGHSWFPLTPGRYTDFRIRRYPIDEPTYVRVTTGEPELFFGRMATPWVYGEVPGLPVDATLFGLRQYYSVAPDGSLWSHGAQNNGIMSYMEPPVRQLLADPVPGAAWVDTALFESFFPGMVPIFSGELSFASQLSDRAFLDLAGTPVHALRRAQVVDDLRRAGALAPAALGLDGAILAEALLGGESFASAANAARLTAAAAAPRESDPAPVLARDSGRDRPALVAKKGIWFAREQGFVARDYPHGPGGPSNINITTYERIGHGFGPVPPPQPAP